MPHRYGFLFLFLLAVIPAFAQTDSTGSFNGNDIVALSDGSILVGKIKERTNSSIRFKDKTVGETMFRRSDVRWEMHVENGAVYRITTKSGSSYVGKLTEATARGVLIETSVAGQVAIPFENIRDVQRNAKVGKTMQTNLPQTAEIEYVFYHTLPSAIPLNRDEMYYRNMEILVNSIGYGITDHVTIGGGVMGFVIPYIRANGGWEISRVIISVVV